MSASLVAAPNRMSWPSKRALSSTCGHQPSRTRRELTRCFAPSARERTASRSTYAAASSDHRSSGARRSLVSTSWRARWQRDLGRELGEGSSGGGSDGNLTAALGVPTLDGLGAVGEGPHALHEHIEIDAIPWRAALVAGLLTRLDEAT